MTKLQPSLSNCVKICVFEIFYILFYFKEDFGNISIKELLRKLNLPVANNVSKMHSKYSHNILSNNKFVAIGLMSSSNQGPNVTQ